MKVHRLRRKKYKTATVNRKGTGDTGISTGGTTSSGTSQMSGKGVNKLERYLKSLV